MGEKDELKQFFIGEKEIDTSGIPEFPGDLINYSLQSIRKELEFRTEFKMPKEISMSKKDTTISSTASIQYALTLLPEDAGNSFL